MPFLGFLTLFTSLSVGSMDFFIVSQMLVSGCILFFRYDLSSLDVTYIVESITSVCLRINTSNYN